MLEWFDAHPAAYWRIAWSCFGGLLLVTFTPLIAGLRSGMPVDFTTRITPRWLYLSILFLTFFSFRWPLFFVNEELNPDESQIIAGAITLRHDPLYWRSVDGMTHGPLDDYPLMLPWLAGQTPGYLSARLIAACLVLGAVMLLYCTLIRYVPDPIARVGTLPAFCFFAFSTYWDFVHYSSEHMPVFLLASGLYFLTADLRGPERQLFSWRWLGAGITLGALPLAKLQAAPIAAVLLLTGATLDFFSGRLSRHDRWWRGGVLLAGSVLIPGTAGALLLAADQWHHAWNSYVVQNVAYVEARDYSSMQMLRQFWHYANVGGFFAYAVGSALFLMIGFLVVILRRRRADTGRNGTRNLMIFAGVFLLASFISVLTPGRQISHYLLFLVMPAGFGVSIIFAACWQTCPEKSTTPAQIQPALLITLFFSLLVWPQIQWRISLPHSYVGRLVDCANPPVDLVALQILRYVKPGESLGQWGWMCRFYVRTGMRQATREAHSHYQILPSPQLDYFRARYLADLKTSYPPVFIDTVGENNFGYTDRAKDHESFPALRDFIARHYKLTADIYSTRVYVRNDRLAQP